MKMPSIGYRYTAELALGGMFSKNEKTFTQKQAETVISKKFPEYYKLMSKRAKSQGFNG